MTEHDPPPADNNKMPKEIPLEMTDLYHREVHGLLEEMEIFAQAAQEKDSIAGDRLLQEMWAASKRESTCEALEWMVDELQGLLSLQGDMLLSNPHYAMQAVQELLERCYQKLGMAQTQSAADVQREVARKRREGYYRSQAELMLISREIEALIGGIVEKPDLNALSETLEKEDLTRMMAAIAPEVRRERERLGKIEKIALSGNASALLGLSLLKPH